MKTLLVRGMHGLGDNLHQRGVIRQLMRDAEVWLETPWPSVYHDLVGDRLKLVNTKSTLRTQAKNAWREVEAYSVPPRRFDMQLPVLYRPETVRMAGSVLGAMVRHCGVDLMQADFRLPLKAEWLEAAEALLEQHGYYAQTKPLMIYRPLVERTEWGGCASRNPDHAAYAALEAMVRDQFFTVSVADLVPGKEWIAGEPLAADVTLHHGEVDFGVMAALFWHADLVFAAPGFAVILAQAVETPVVCVFGGYEDSSSFSAGAVHAPYLGIDPIHPCNCFSHNHACRKEIDLDLAKSRLLEFVDEHSIYRSVAA